MTLSGVQLHLVEDTADVAAFMRWLGEDRNRSALGFDCETGGLWWWKQPLRLVQFGDAEQGWAIPWGQWPGLVREVFRVYDGDFVAHHAPFDVHFLEQNDVQVPRERVHDTLPLAHLVDPTVSNGLKKLAERYIDPRAASSETALAAAMAQEKWGWDTVPVNFPLYWAYGALDPVLTVNVLDTLRPLATRYEAAYDLEVAVRWTLMDMERRGSKIDVNYTRGKLAELQEHVDRCHKRGQDEWGVKNIGSNDQVARKLRDDGVQLTKRTEKGKWALDEDVLTELDHPLAQLTLEARKATKICGTYLETLLEMRDKNDIVHCSVNSIGARTGRMSVRDPALQTLPRGTVVRDCFIPEDEERRLVLCDYDQVELRLMAHYGQVEGMLDAIRNGDDLHTRTAQLAYGYERDEEPPREKRQVAKNANFAKIYGAGPAKFALTAGISQAEAESFLHAYDRAYPGVRRFQEKVGEVATKRLNSEGIPYVETTLGRRLPAERSKIYTLVNYLIQGEASELLKRKLVELDNAGLGGYLRLPVHDEVVSDVEIQDAEEVAAEIQQVMTERKTYSVELSCQSKVVYRWGDAYREED